jgi:hypothetical protein
MLFFAAGIFSDRGAGVPDPEGDPGKWRKNKNFRIWEFHCPRETTPKGKKPPDGRRNDDFGETGLNFKPSAKLRKVVNQGG